MTRATLKRRAARAADGLTPIHAAAYLAWTFSQRAAFWYGAAIAAGCETHEEVALFTQAGTCLSPNPEEGR